LTKVFYVDEDNLDDDDCFTENRFWWSAATVSAQWIVNDNSEQSELYQYVERPPQTLSMSKYVSNIHAF